MSTWCWVKAICIVTDSGDGVVGVLECNKSKLLPIVLCIIDEAESQWLGQDAVSDELYDVFDKRQTSSERVLFIVICRVDYEDQFAFAGTP